MATKGQKLLAAGTVVAAAEPLLALAHTGGVGVIVGIAAGAIAYHAIEDIEKAAGRDGISLPAAKLRDSSQPSIMYRILNGKSTRPSHWPTEEAVNREVERVRAMEAAQQQIKDDTPATPQDALQMGDTFTPHASAVLSKRIGIFGIPGSGKSNALTVFIEEIGRLHGVGVPFLLCDTEDEYSNLHNPSYLTRPYKAGAHNVTPETAFQFGQQLLERGRQVILNLASYEGEDEAALVMINIIAGMREYAEAHENEDRATCFVILDEASIWLPQRQEESPLSKEKDEDKMTLLARLQQSFFGTLVRRGRKRGIGFVFATQRPADLDKRAISCDWFFLFRQTYPNDLAVYAKIGVVEETAKSLQAGQCVVLDPQGDRTTHQFRKRRSPDVSATPGLASLKKYARQWSEPDPITEDFDRSVISASVTRNVVPQTPPPSSKIAEFADVTVTSPVRDVSIEEASEAGGTGQNEDVMLPDNWTEMKVNMLPGFYRVLSNLDKSLEALEVPVTQRNRDYGRDILRKQGLWKEK